MPIEIVGQDETQQIRATCKECGAILSFYRVDRKYEGGDADSLGYHYVRCPNCAAKVILKENEHNR